MIFSMSRGLGRVASRLPVWKDQTSQQRATALGAWINRRPVSPTRDTTRDDLYSSGGIGIRIGIPSASDPIADELALRRYRQRGYAVSPDAMTTDLVLEARKDTGTVGTLTIGVDTPSGLRADTTFGAELAPLRAEGRRLCEFRRLAVDVHGGGKHVLALLFHLGYIVAYRILRASDLVIEVNPRHVAFYRYRLGFRVLGEERSCPRVDAPAVLLHRPLRDLSEDIARFGGLRIKQNRSFYANGLTPWEENELAARANRLISQLCGDGACR